jgi:hypothetical protein
MDPRKFKNISRPNGNWSQSRPNWQAKRDEDRQFQAKKTNSLQALIASRARATTGPG